ncbi:MAG: type I methionyl aminopeptidase [Chloroflexi bacterium]|nr:type I methionyl aminopeptidase [Chloroflexota bacterium]
MPITLKSPNEIRQMREVGRIVVATLRALREVAAPGVTTLELDRIAYETVSRLGGQPAFLGYRGFPGSICASINEEVVHGIPSATRILREGDIVSLDFGAVARGLYADSAITVGVGAINLDAQRLLDVTQEALRQGINRVRVGGRLTDIGAAIEDYVLVQGFSVVREYVGHGIGRAMHEEPQIPNYGPPGKGPVLRPGMVLAIEPMVNLGTWQTKVCPDKWTVVTADGSLSAHFEHTVAVSSGGPQVLTLPED